MPQRRNVCHMLSKPESSGSTSIRLGEHPSSGILPVFFTRTKFGSTIEFSIAHAADASQIGGASASGVDQLCVDLRGDCSFDLCCIQSPGLLPPRRSPRLFHDAHRHVSSRVPGCSLCAVSSSRNHSRASQSQRRRNLGQRHRSGG